MDAKKAAKAHKFNGENVSIVKNGNYYNVSGKDFKFNVNLQTGLLEDYYYQEKLLMKQGAGSRQSDVQNWIMITQAMLIS